MTERVSEYWRQWLSPGIVMGVIGWLLLLVGAWYRLSALEGKFSELSSIVTKAAEANQEAEKESIRYQEQLRNLETRLGALERFRDAQTDYNASTMATLAVLKKEQ